MNIGILIPGFGANETDWALPVYQNFARQLGKSHHVRVIALRYPHTRKPYKYQGVDVYPLRYGAWTKGIRRFRLWWDTVRLVRKLHRQNPFDILHGIWADETGALSGWIGKHLKIPSVVTIAGGELVGFPQLGYGLQLSRYSRWIVGQALKHNTAVIMLSDLTSQLDQTGYNVNHLVHIPLGVDPDMFYPSDIRRKPEHLIHVGSLIPIKNQKLLLDTLVRLDDTVTLDIIGEGQLEAELKDYAIQLGISHRVNFLGNIPHAQLREHYSRTQLHVTTSHHEAFGMAILEAGACGTPTVGTSVGLLSEDWNQQVTAQSADELARIIHSLLTSESKLETLRREWLLRVQENYTIQKVVSEHMILYQSLIY